MRLIDFFSCPDSWSIWTCPRKRAKKQTKQTIYLFKENEFGLVFCVEHSSYSADIKERLGFVAFSMKDLFEKGEPLRIS